MLNQSAGEKIHFRQLVLYLPNFQENQIRYPSSIEPQKSKTPFLNLNILKNWNIQLL